MFKHRKIGEDERCYCVSVVVQPHMKHRERERAQRPDFFLRDSCDAISPMEMTTFLFSCYPNFVMQIPIVLSSCVCVCLRVSAKCQTISEPSTTNNRTIFQISSKIMQENNDFGHICEFVMATLRTRPIHRERKVGIFDF